MIPGTPAARTSQAVCTAAAPLARCLTLQVLRRTNRSSPLSGRVLGGRPVPCLPAEVPDALSFTDALIALPR
jgi:hypothetical protein